MSTLSERVILPFLDDDAGVGWIVLEYSALLGLT